MDWEVDPQSQKRLDAIAKAITKGGKLYLATDPDREGEAISWHVRDVLRHKKALEGVDVKRVTFNAITKQSVLDAVAHPRELDQHADRRLHGAPRARLPGGLHPVARAVAQAAGQPLGRPRAVGGAAPDLRARGRDRGLQDPRILDGRRPVRHRQEADAQGPPHPSRRPQARQVRPRHPGARRAGQARDRAPRLLGGLDRPPPGPPQPAAALHHLDPAAGGLAQARRRRRHGHAHRPAAVRGRRHRRRDRRPHHLYAHRRRAARPRGDRPDPPPDRDQVRPELRAREAARLHVQGQERPGGARGDPPDRPVPHAAGRRRLLGQGPARPLRADLEAHRRQPDGKRRARPGDGRHRQRRQDRAAARHRLGREVRRLPHALRRGQGRERHEDEEGNAILPDVTQDEAPRAPRRHRPSSISPSRRRAIPRPAWSRSWRSSASAGPRPTPASSRCCSAGTT